MNNKLINDNENVKATIGYGYLKNIISNSASTALEFIDSGITDSSLKTLTSMSKTFGIVTDKRVYCFGKTYESINGKIRSTRGRKIIDITDVTGTSIIKTRNIWALLIGLIFILISVAYTVTTIVMGTVSMIFSAAVTTILISILVILAYRMLRKNYISIEYAGGGIRLQTYMESDASIENFQNTIIQLKDKTKDDKNNNKVELNINQARDEIAELKKAQKMLEDGLINEEDYNKLKSKILDI